MDWSFAGEVLGVVPVAYVVGTLSAGVMLVAVLAMLPESYKYWLGRPSRFDAYDARMELWPHGVTAWRIFRRSITALCLLGLPFLLSTMTFMIVGGGGTPVGAFAESALFAFGAIESVGVISVVLINRPRLLVPPHLRDEPGLLASWLG